MTYFLVLENKLFTQKMSDGPAGFIIDIQLHILNLVLSETLLFTDSKVVWGGEENSGILVEGT